jgi:hypothetical protein
MRRIEGTDREFLKNAISAAQDFFEGRAPYSLEIFLLDLHDVDQSKNEILWKELLQALRNNPYLHEPGVLDFFDRPYFVEDSYWWWNTDLWLSDNKEIDEI